MILDAATQDDLLRHLQNLREPSVTENPDLLGPTAHAWRRARNTLIDNLRTNPNQADQAIRVFIGLTNQLQGEIQTSDPRFATQLNAVARWMTDVNNMPQALPNQLSSPQFIGGVPQPGPLGPSGSGSSWGQHISDANYSHRLPQQTPQGAALGGGLGWNNNGAQGQPHVAAGPAPRVPNWPGNVLGAALPAYHPNWPGNVGVGAPMPQPQNPYNGPHGGPQYPPQVNAHVPNWPGNVGVGAPMPQPQNPYNGPHGGPQYPPQVNAYVPNWPGNVGVGAPMPQPQNPYNGPHGAPEPDDQQRNTPARGRNRRPGR